jgi:hypothetical protein
MKISANNNKKTIELSNILIEISKKSNENNLKLSKEELQIFLVLICKEFNVSFFELEIKKSGNAGHCYFKKDLIGKKIFCLSN